MKIPNFLKSNLLLKITSVNAPIIIIRQVLSLFIRRIVAENFGEAGIDIIGQLRSIQQGVLSLTSFGFFNGIVKYVAEYKEDQDKLNGLFSTAFVFWSISSLIIGILLTVFSSSLSQYFFGSPEYASVLIVTGIVAPAIGLQRIYNGVVNGLTEYKRFAKVDLSSYLVSAAMMLYFAWNNEFTYALYSIVITPAIQLGILIYVFFKTFKNYMAFSSLLFTMYVIPKFATIKTRPLFFKEVKHIYISLLPLFGVGMIVIYFLRHFIIDLIFPGFDGMAPLFKWQLMGDFIRLAASILAYQFLAKKMVRNFIFSEVISTGLFFGLSYYLVPIYGVEGVVMAHFYRYLVYLPLVVFLVWRSFRRKTEEVE